MAARKKTEEELPLLTSWTQLPPTIELHQERVEVTPWGVAVLVQEWTGSLSNEYKRGNFTRDGSSLRLTLEHQDLRKCVLSMVDGNGNRLFPDMKRGIAHLEKLPVAGANLIVAVVDKLNKETPAAKEEIEGNSEPEETGDSTSDSPGTSTEL
jgi:hypothetical protein